MGYAWVSLLIHFPLAMDEVSGHIHQVQNAIDRLVPIPQHELLILNGSEVDHPVDAVDPAGDHMFIIQSAELLLAVLPLDLQQLAHSGESELSVVLADDADVVLHQHALQLSQVVLDKEGSTFALG